jgi:RNA polymerase sigma-70 factor (ECF subfamily)
MTFKEVYDEHFRFVWRSLRRLSVPEADVQDAVQEVFVVVHRRLHEFEGRAKLTTWLYRICLRVARDRRRRAHVRREVPVAEHDDRCTGATTSASEALERLDDLALFNAAMGELDTDQAAVFSLFELEAMSGQDIASLLDIPLGTVYSRLRLGREAFRKAVLRLAAQRRTLVERRES